VNLRDKLRGQTPTNLESTVEAAEPTAAFADDVAAPDAAPAKGKGKGKEKGAKAPRESLVSKLDVNRRFLMLAGAVAAITAVMAVMYLGKAGSGLEAAGAPIKVLVAKEDIAAGARLTEDMFKFKEIPQSLLIDEQFFESFEDLDGRLAVAPMVAGEPVYDIRTSPPNPKYGIAYLLKPGERAKSISVDSASGMAGLIKPGNEVDLIATIPDPEDSTRRISTPVVQKARVIAVGDILLGAPPPSDDDTVVDNGISSTGTITLAVPSKKIPLVTLLEDLGNMKTILRAEGDDTVAQNPYSDAQMMQLISGRVPKLVTPPPYVAPPKPTYVAPKPKPVQQAPARPVSRPTYVAPRPQPKPVQPAKPKPQPKPVKPQREVQVIQFGQ
jgi:pilus assembly protein CpaB